jgi:hypothetical protein
MMSFVSTYAYRWFGIFECSREGLRSRNIEISWRPGLALGLYHYGDEGSRYGVNIQLGWPSIHFKIPLRRYAPKDLGGFGLSWGFTFFDKSLQLKWGDKCKIIDMPWASGICVRSSNLLKDGTWAHEDPRRNRSVSFDDFRAARDAHSEFVRANEWVEQYPYRYVLRSGEVQERIATVKVEEREWRQHWLKWTRLFANVQRTISIDFSDEVGERSGSWKGGCTGCGYELRPNETPEQSLRRMEAERKF